MWDINTIQWSGLNQASFFLFPNNFWKNPLIEYTIYLVGGTTFNAFFHKKCLVEYGTPKLHSTNKIFRKIFL